MEAISPVGERDSLTPPPRVSVGLPVYNGARWLAESVDSILSQTFTDFELILSDNASTDGTAAICQEYARRDSRVLYVRNSRNIGGMRNASQVFRMASGEYFRWAAHDDRCEPTLLERLVRDLDDHPEAVVATCCSISIDENGIRMAQHPVVRVAERVWIRRKYTVIVMDDQGERYPLEGTSGTPSRRFRQLLMTTGPCEGLYGLIRSSALRQTDLLPPYTGSDFVLLGNLGLLGKFSVTDEPLFCKRWHDSNRYDELGPGRMVWSRPDLAETGQITMPHWLQLSGYLSVVKRATYLSSLERVRCVGSVARWARVKWKTLGFEIAYALVMMSHSRERRKRCYDPNHWKRPSEISRYFARTASQSPR
jgi:glycosyltransferase involved in cell wall biosynthesis